ncbi:MAG: Mov34/MPN/PAD-1 family protein, partial [Dehalococcoidia bacterium]
MALNLPQSMIDEMVAHAKEDLPNECCGVITGNGGTATKLYRTRNAEPSPFRYSIDPRDLLKIEQETDETGESILVIYHSHVASEAYPSPTDVRLSQW